MSYNAPSTLPAMPADEGRERAAGFYQYQARTNFRDLCRIYGFGGARQIIAEIINDEAERKSDDTDRA